MIGTYAYVKEGLWLLVPLVLTLVAILLKLRGRRVPFIVVIVFPLILLIQISILTRQYLATEELRHLSADRILSISYRGVNIQDRNEILTITRSLNTSTWYSSRRSDIADREALTIHYVDGSDWDLMIGRNRYGTGSILQMSPRGFSRGYAFNRDLFQVLTNLTDRRAP